MRVTVGYLLPLVVMKVEDGHKHLLSLSDLSWIEVINFEIRAFILHPDTTVQPLHDLRFSDFSCGKKSHSLWHL